jgi:hypothetical protein
MSKIPSKEPIRLTIVIDSEVESKLRELHGQIISSESKNFSFSKIVNMVLLAGIVSADKLDNCDWYLLKSLIDGKKIFLDEFTGRDYITNLAAIRCTA